MWTMVQGTDLNLDGDPGHCLDPEIFSLLVCRVKNLKFATYLKFPTCENTNKINELW